MGGGGREREISPDPGQLWGLSWSGGLHLLVPGGLSLSSFCLSLSVQLDVQKPLNPPPPSLYLPDPGQFCPAMHGHLWEFIPDASCSLHPLVFPSLFSICHTDHPNPHPPTHPTLHMYMFLLFSTVNHLYFLSIFPCWNLSFSYSSMLRS